MRPNISLGDTLAGLHGAFGAVMALLHRQRHMGHVPGQVSCLAAEALLPCSLERGEQGGGGVFPSRAVTLQRLLVQLGAEPPVRLC